MLPSDLAPDGVSDWIDYHGGLDRLSRVGTFRATGDAVLRRKGASVALPPCGSIVPGSGMQPTLVRLSTRRRNAIAIASHGAPPTTDMNGRLLMSIAISPPTANDPQSAARFANSRLVGTLNTANEQI